MRRLSLSLCGTIPSLEEVRRFESRPAGRRIDAWLEDLLHDRRCADYLAERFARAFVGTEDGPFLKFRRRRFVAWLSDAILENRRYDAIVRDLIADRWPLDRPSGDQLPHGDDRREDRAAHARPAGGAGVAGVPRGAARLCPVPRPSLPAVEAGPVPRPGRLLRRGPLRPPRHPRHRERLPASRPQGQGVAGGRAPRPVPRRGHAGDRGRRPARPARRAGSPTRATPTSPASRSTGSGRSCSAARWPSRWTTCPPPASSIRP